MPPKKRRGSGWEQRPKRSSAASAPPETQQPPEDVLKAAEIGDEAKPGKRRGIVSFAVDLWSSCYEKFFAAELAEVEAFAGQLPQSSYRARLKGAKAAAYDKKLANRVRQTSASHRRQTNQQIWTHSLVARSLSWYNQRVPHRIWRDVLEERVIASRPSCLLVLEEMRRVEPQPAWIASPHLFVVGADQTYMWQGCKKRGRGKQKAGEPPSPPPLPAIFMRPFMRPGARRADVGDWDANGHQERGLRELGALSRPIHCVRLHSARVGRADGQWPLH